MVMSVFAWKAEYSVGIRQIDDQHKQLVAMINDLHEAMAEGKGRDILGEILAKLIVYTKEHFASEEALMEKHGYPDFPSHKVAHAKMTKKVMELQKEFEASDVKHSIEVGRFLQQWLNKHILETDKQYSSFLHKKGVS
jgi:hemerythrin